MVASIWAADSGTPDQVILTQNAFRNRIINGDMRVDQRSPGAAYTFNVASVQYGLDRWAGYSQTGEGVFTLQRLSLSPPPGFTNFMRATITVADAVIGPIQAYLFMQRIEGYNIADLDWGLSSAKPVVLSFYVRSSVAGPVSGALINNAADRSYPFSFVINTAAEWERKVIPILGDTAGAWLKDNGNGVTISFVLGAGVDFLSTAGSWQPNLFYGVNGTTQFISDLGAVLDITGVQFEPGSQVTDFEFRSYADELRLCQRYYEKESYEIWSGMVTAAQAYHIITRFRVDKRIAPTMAGADLGSVGFAAGVPNFTGIVSDVGRFRAEKAANATVPGGYFAFSWTANAEL